MSSLDPDVAKKLRKTAKRYPVDYGIDVPREITQYNPLQVLQKTYHPRGRDFAEPVYVLYDRELDHTFVMERNGFILNTKEAHIKSIFTRQQQR